MVLQHVLERADSVVVAGPALERERLLPHDLDLGDMVAVPDGLEDPVGEPPAQQVLDCGHGQEVVDTEDRPLRHEVGQQLVEVDRAVQVLAEWLLQDDPAGGVQAGVA